MRYYVTIDGDPPGTIAEVDLVERPNGSLDVTLDGRPVALEMVPVGRLGQLSVRVDGHIVDLALQGEPPLLYAVASGHRTPARVESERARATTPPVDAARGAGREIVVRSPMPGRVVRVLVARAQGIVTGEGLVIIEAMKMENEVLSRTNGTVVDVHVVAGQAVEANARLVTITST